MRVRRRPASAPSLGPITHRSPLATITITAKPHEKLRPCGERQALLPLHAKGSASHSIPRRGVWSALRSAIYSLRPQVTRNSPPHPACSGPVPRQGRKRFWPMSPQHCSHQSSVTHTHIKKGGPTRVNLDSSLTSHFHGHMGHDHLDPWIHSTARNWGKLQQWWTWLVGN